MSKPEEFKFDSRVRDRFLRSRALSAADLKRHLEQLPDLEGEYEVTETPQPAVAPARSEHTEEPLMFEGIRRLSALSDAQPSIPARPSAGLPPAPVPREEPRPLGTPLRSAFMETPISGVGAGAVSAALGAMAAEREASGREASGRLGTFDPLPPAPMVQPAPEPEPSTPVTLRSEPTPDGVDETADSFDPSVFEAGQADSEDLA